MCVSPVSARWLTIWPFGSHSAACLLILTLLGARSPHSNATCRRSQKTQALVHEGHVALEGTVEWHYQREWAERAARSVPGVISVRNSIRLKPQLTPAEITRQIEQAFQRSATVDAQRVTVETLGDEATHAVSESIARIQYVFRCDAPTTGLA